VETLINFRRGAGARPPEKVYMSWPSTLPKRCFHCRVPGGFSRDSLVGSPPMPLVSVYIYNYFRFLPYMKVCPKCTARLALIFECKLHTGDTYPHLSLPRNKKSTARFCDNTTDLQHCVAGCSHGRPLACSLYICESKAMERNDSAHIHRVHNAFKDPPAELSTWSQKYVCNSCTPALWRTTPGTGQRVLSTTHIHISHVYFWNCNTRTTKRIPISAGVYIYIYNIYIYIYITDGLRVTTSRWGDGFPIVLNTFKLCRLCVKSLERKQFEELRVCTAYLSFSPY